MTPTIIIIFGIAIIVILLTKKTKGPVAGICALALDRNARKNGNKEKIVTLLGERGELGNADIREALGVSERTAVRYMDELEREGKAEQAGNTGRGVRYRLKR